MIDHVQMLGTTSPLQRGNWQKLALEKPSRRLVDGSRIAMMSITGTKYQRKMTRRSGGVTALSSEKTYLPPQSCPLGLSMSDDMMGRLGWSGGIAKHTDTYALVTAGGENKSSRLPRRLSSRECVRSAKEIFCPRLSKRRCGLQGTSGLIISGSVLCVSFRMTLRIGNENVLRWHRSTTVPIWTTAAATKSSSGDGRLGIHGNSWISRSPGQIRRARTITWSSGRRSTTGLSVSNTMSNFPPMGRGRVHQGRMLSPRVLRPGYYELFSECSSEAYCERGSIGFLGDTEGIPTPARPKTHVFRSFRVFRVFS